MITAISNSEVAKLGLYSGCIILYKNITNQYNFYSILREFITPNISRCRVNRCLYRPTTGRKSNFFNLHLKFQFSYLIFSVGWGFFDFITLKQGDKETVSSCY